jgi:hypothetical protein
LILLEQQALEIAASVAQVLFSPSYFSSYNRFNFDGAVKSLIYSIFSIQHSMLDVGCSTFIFLLSFPASTSVPPAFLLPFTLYKLEEMSTMMTMNLAYQKSFYVIKN